MRYGTIYLTGTEQAEFRARMERVAAQFMEMKEQHILKIISEQKPLKEAHIVGNELRLDDE